MATMDSWQNVTREENENCYIRQWGIYSAHGEPSPARPADVAATSGACAFLSHAGRLHFVGPVDRLPLPDDLLRYFIRNKPVALFATASHFAGLVDITDGRHRLLVWGPSLNATTLQAYGEDVYSVYAGSQSFIVVHRAPVNERWIDVIGGSLSDEVPNALQLKWMADPPVSVRVTEKAYAALTAAGKVTAWGSPQHGGSIPSSAAALLERMVVKRIFATTSAFCAVDDDGQLVTWGAVNGGGEIPSATLESIMDDGGALTIVAARDAFTCVTRSRRKALAWGNAAGGGTMTAESAALASIGHIAICKATTRAFCIVTDGGQYGAWGLEGEGGRIPVDTTASANTADAPPNMQTDMQGALRRVFASSASVSSAPAPTWIGGMTSTQAGSVSVHATQAGFLLVTTDADRRCTAIHAWGKWTDPPEPVKQVLLSSRLQWIGTGNRACFAVVEQGETEGCLLLWGDAVGGSSVPAISYDIFSSPVEAVYPINTVVTAATPQSTPVGFISRHKDGTMVTWGIRVPTLIVGPGE